MMAVEYMKSAWGRNDRKVIEDDGLHNHLDGADCGQFDSERCEGTPEFKQQKKLQKKETEKTTIRQPHL